MAGPPPTDSGLPTSSSTKKPRGPTVVCTCEVCKKLVFKNDQGQWQPGREVSRTTRSNHSKKDRLAEEAANLTAATTSSSSAQPQIEDDRAIEEAIGEDAEVDQGTNGGGFDPHALVGEDDSA